MKSDELIKTFIDAYRNDVTVHTMHRAGLPERDIIVQLVRDKRQLLDESIRAAEERTHPMLTWKDGQIVPIIVEEKQ